MDFDDHDDELPKTVGDPSSASGHSQHRSTKPTSSALTNPTTGPKYRECLKNHAVTIGGHATDGCGEFMPAGDDGTLDALRCAACNCHRNFHRKESSDSNSSPGADYHHQFSPYYRTPAGYLHHHHHHHPLMLPHQRAPAPLALPSTSGGGGHSRGMDEEELSDPMTVMGSGGSGSSSKKRFRTKFTQEQKDRMLGFAERVGWRIQKHDEGAVQEFCNETGVKRHVLKVWMHNNKHTLGKKP